MDGHNLLALFWLRIYVTSWIVVAPQSSARGLFYSTVYYITFNPICVAQSVSKNGEKNCGRQG
jgi:hypothetical protein